MGERVRSQILLVKLIRSNFNLFGCNISFTKQAESRDLHSFRPSNNVQLNKTSAQAVYMSWHDGKADGVPSDLGTPSL